MRATQRVGAAEAEARQAREQTAAATRRAEVAAADAVRAREEAVAAERTLRDEVARLRAEHVRLSRPLRHLERRADAMARAWEAGGASGASEV